MRLKVFSSGLFSYSLTIAIACRLRFLRFFTCVSWGIFPLQILLIEQTTAIRHSIFCFSSFFLCLFNLEFQNLLLCVPSVLSCVLFCSLSLSFPSYFFLLFVLFPVLFSPSVYSIYFLISLIIFFSRLLSFLFSFPITLCCLLLPYALLLFNLLSFY